MGFGEELLRAAAERTDLPLEYASGLPRVELDGPELLRVEPHRGLAAYGPELVVVRCGNGELRVRGSGLRLETMTNREVKLRGRVRSLELAY